MKPLAHAERTRTGGLVSLVTLVAASSIAVVLAFAPAAQAAATSVDLGTAEPFAVLAGQGITNTGPTTVNSDIGSSPNQSITGTATLTVNGIINPAGTAGAKNDLTTAYNVAAGENPPTQIISADLGGRTLVSGIYKSTSGLGLTGALTLNGQGNPNSIFIFQAGSTLTTASGSSVVLINGAQACNVFWQVGSSATLGTGTKFVGNILALSSIAVQTRTTIQGRALARNGSVTLDTNVITRSRCSTTTPSPTPTSTTTASPTPTSTTTASPTPTSTTTASPTPTSTTTASPSATASPTATPSGTATSTGEVSETPSGAPGTGSDTGAGGPGLQAAGLAAVLLLAGLTVVTLSVRRRGNHQ